MTNKSKQTPSKHFKWDVFVSHNKRQKPWVGLFVEQLRESGLHVFFDKDDIPPGADVVRSIEQGIQQSQHLLFIITPSSVASDWVALETGLAVYSDLTAKEGRLIPVLLEQTPDADIRPTIRKLNRIDLTDPTKRTAEYNRLLKHLRISEPFPEPPALKPPRVRNIPPRRTKPDMDMLARQTLRVPLTYLACSYYREKHSNSDFLIAPDEMPILTRQDLIPSAPLPLADVDRLLRWEPNHNDSETSCSEGDMVHSLRMQTPSKVYDGVIYRFLDFEDSGGLRFCRGNYFAFLNTCEYLSLELAKAVSENQFALDIVVANNRSEFHSVVKWLLEHPDLIPVRNGTELFEFSARCSAFGTCALVVVKRTNKPAQMILNLRSTQLTETPDLLHVIPAGTFQPNMTDDRFHGTEFSFTENIVREFAEELLDAQDLRKPKVELLEPNDMYSKRGKNFRQHVVNNGNFIAYYLGTVIDPVNLKPEIVTVFMVHDGYLFNTGKHQLMKSWESGRLSIHDFSTSELDFLIGKTNLVPTGKAHLMLVRKHYEFLTEVLSTV